MRGRVVFGMFGADMLLSCDESAIVLLLGGRNSAGESANVARESQISET